jgi:phosphoribosylamine--glycine ligase
MRVLIVGSGGREHALAWKTAQSPRLTQLFVAPGNAGTEVKWTGGAARNLALQPHETAALVDFARQQALDLVIIGPEAPLAGGLADELRAAGVRVFGPSRAAAEIESSKAFAKAFMQRHGLPSARFATFTDFYAAVGHLLAVDYPVVIKASGLAAGKGVSLPECADDAEAALRRLMLEHEFGPAGDEVIIEERLSGPEVSLLAFTDGVSVKPMPPAQDHKRLLDGDQGPNTGGMGAYAPAALCPPALAADLARTILQPAVDGLRAEGRPFAGVLYAGVMLTHAGPRVLEFNCRFGDPETQVLLPLLDTDLLDIAQACAAGRLAEVDIRWKPGAAACVVLASAGYPGTYAAGRFIEGLDAPLDNAIVFHAGTRRVGDRVVTAGGRVLGVTGWGDTLPRALAVAYGAAKLIGFEGCQYRRDIGHQALAVTP